MMLVRANGVIYLRPREHHFWRFASNLYLPFSIPSYSNASDFLIPSQNLQASNRSYHTPTR